MSVIRAFIAIELPEELQQQLDIVSAHLMSKMENLPVRWVPAKNIHLTLKFLGDVSTSSLDVLTKLIESETGEYRTFEISVGGLGAFPNDKRPRVIWIGIEAPPELLAVQRAIEIETGRLGYSSDQRPFTPHLTLGRVPRNANPQDVRGISKELMKESVGFLGAARVHEIHLFKSELRPSGAIYTKLHTVTLQDI